LTLYHGQGKRNRSGKINYTLKMFVYVFVFHSSHKSAVRIRELQTKSDYKWKTTHECGTNLFINMLTGEEVVFMWCCYVAQILTGDNLSPGVMLIRSEPS
jgi:hypothetical protein